MNEDFEIELYRCIALAACEAASPQASLLRCLARICGLLDWSVGHAYLPLKRQDVLTSGSLWYLTDPLRFRSFQEHSEALEFPAGRGVVGEVFATGVATSLPDLGKAPKFVRAQHALQVGLQSAVAIPVRAGAEIVGVVEFFSTDPGGVAPALLETLERAVSLLGKVLVRKRLEFNLVKQALTSDALTYLPNRRSFSDRLNDAISESRRSGKAGAIFFLDLDRFKVINETLGYDQGDRLLRGVAERLLAFSRQYEGLARLGGDEFTILLPEAGEPEEIACTAHAILNTLARPFTLDGHEVYVTASIGISHFPADGEDSSTLMKHANSALVQAKKSQNCFQFYQSSMQAATSERLILEHHLRRAMESDELVLHYQPQICLKSGRIIGAEVLVRWQHPELGLVPPGKFIPLAEETGLIIPMTEHILRQACDEGHCWQGMGLAPIRIAVNLSGNHFKRAGLVESVAEILLQTGFEPQYLELELTEGILMENVESTIGTLNALSAMGIKFAIDDFGTGYSSLGYLKRFPLSILKIDQSFVQGIATSREDQAIVSAIIALAHRLNLKVIAEGVETEEQRNFLDEHGCDYAQGYLFSRPLPVAKFARLLSGNSRDAAGRRSRVQPSREHRQAQG